MNDQSWDPQRYAANGRFVADLGAPLLDLLAPLAHESILDLGCGDGALTERIAASGARVLGVDASAAMVQAARLRRLDARIADGGALPFASEFDAVFSNAALHWMKRDPDAVIRNVWRALRPGGRFVGEMGGAGNVSEIMSALHRVLARHGIDAATADPWFFPDRADYQRRLESCGFVVKTIEIFPRPTALPGDMRGWLETFAWSFFALVPAGQRSEIMDEVQTALLPVSCSGADAWTVNYVRLRFLALKPAAREHAEGHAGRL
ncbi:MAG: class I SAM-dependent methyltransferase [Acidiferrobacterales bacterium]